jgi:death on curing protein
MMRLLTLRQVLRLHELIMAQAGVVATVRDLAGLESAVAQPWMTFGGSDLYPSLHEKAAAIGFSLIRNHPFVDGNKRIGHAAIEATLGLNGRHLVADIDEAERVILGVAAATIERDELLRFVEQHTQLRTLAPDR